MEFGALAGGLGCFPLDYECYHSQSVSRATLSGIRSLIGVGKLVRPLTHSVLYLRQRPPEAIPKYVSGRTSYFRV